MPRSPHPAAWELVGEVRAAAPYVLTCDHASNLVPDELGVSESDRALLAEHWGWDIGAADLTRALSEILGCPGVLSGFSRLVVDPNRRPGDPGYVVREIDGVPLSFNRDLSEEEIERRTRRYVEPYHDAVDDLVRRQLSAGPAQLLAIHSFTPLYLGRARPMEIGVLFDDHDEEAWRLESALGAEGFEVALNAPYSGKGPDGLIHSARRHGLAHGIVYLELEVRQDRIDTPDQARSVAERIARAVAALDG